MAETEGYVAVADKKEIDEGEMRLEELKVQLYSLLGMIVFLSSTIAARIWVVSFLMEASTATSSFVPAMTGALTKKTGKYENQPNYVLVKYLFKVEAGKTWVKLDEDDF